MPAEQVLTQETIATFLDGELDSVDDEYYLSHTEANNKAIKDRSTEHLAKPVDHVDLSVDVREKQPPKIISTIKPRKTKGGRLCR